MGLSVSSTYKVDISDEAVESVRDTVNRQADQFRDMIDTKIAKVNNKRIADREEHNQKVRDTVLQCQKLYLERQMGQCSQNRLFQTLSGTKDQCNQLDMSLLQCMSDYSELVATRN